MRERQHLQRLLCRPGRKLLDLTYKLFIPCASLANPHFAHDKGDSHVAKPSMNAGRRRLPRHPLRDLESRLPSLVVIERLSFSVHNLGILSVRVP